MDIKINIVGNEARISAPYDEEFLNEMRYHNCRWDFENKEWIADIDLIDIVRTKMKKCFGMDDFTNDFVNVWITIPESEYLVKCCRPVKMFGKVIATATGKKSGAIWGNDIVNISSLCGSGGSFKNWTTWVSKGKFKIKNVSKARILSEKTIYEDDGFIIEIVEPSKINKQILIEERARLMNKINEIDKMIQRDC